jgi:hypothetical protein
MTHAVRLQDEMLGPELLKRVKQCDVHSADQIKNGHLVGFVQAAIRALQRKIRIISDAAFAFGNDVVDMENSRLTDLGEVTIETAGLIALEYPLSGFFRNCG